MTWLQGILQAHPEIAFFLVLRARLPVRQALAGQLQARRGHRHAASPACWSGSSACHCRRGQAVLLPAVPVRDRLPYGPAVLPRPQERRPGACGARSHRRGDGTPVAWVVAGLFGYDAARPRGLVAGSLTESATIGTAMDAIGGSTCPSSSGPHSTTTSRRLRGHLSRRRDRRCVDPLAARAEAVARRPRRGVPQARGADAGRRGQAGHRTTRVRTSRLRRRPGSHFVGRGTTALEAAAHGARVFRRTGAPAGATHREPRRGRAHGGRRGGDVRAAHDPGRGAGGAGQRPARGGRSRNCSSCRRKSSTSW